MSQGALPGFRDFYPEELAQRAYIMQQWRDVMRRYSFVEYDGPPLESLDLYRKKSGDEIVGQLYSFVDKGGREVALRPEMTPTFARMVSARANSIRKPVRWYSIPQLFRYERQQKGRLREHFQLNVDIVGEESVTADAELLAAALDVMRSFGLTSRDVVAKVSDRRLLQSLLYALGVAADQLETVYAVVDKRGREPREVSREKLGKATGDPDIAAAIDSLLEQQDLRQLEAEYGALPAVAGSLLHLRDYFDLVDALGFPGWARLDLSIVRGLAYYTGTVFELYDSAGEMRALCGGGRYDDLLAALGGADLPALGFGMGDVVLGELLRQKGLLPPAQPVLDFWVASDDASLARAAMSLAADIRRRGKSAEFALRPQTLSRQLKAASSAGAAAAVILKAARFAEAEITVKHLGTGAEVTRSITEFLESLN